jgi:hypothetical protein
MAINKQEKCHLHKGKNKSQDEAFTVKECKYKHKNVECYNCHKMGHYKLECLLKGSGSEGQGPLKLRRDEKDKDKDKSKNSKDSVNITAAKLQKDKSWAAIVDVDNAPDEGKFYDTSSALMDSAALILARSEVKLYDPGAFCHMSPFSHCFTNLYEIPPCPITATNSQAFYATGTINLKINVPNDALSTPITLKDALYTSDMGLTVVFISNIAAASYSVVFRG